MLSSKLESCVFIHISLASSGFLAGSNALFSAALVDLVSLNAHFGRILSLIIKELVFSPNTETFKTHVYCAVQILQHTIKHMFVNTYV